MHRVAALQQEASETMKEIEDYLTSRGFCIDTIRDGSGVSLEELDYGNDVTDVLCEKLEEGFGLVDKKDRCYL